MTWSTGPNRVADERYEQVSGKIREYDDYPSWVVLESREAMLYRRGLDNDPIETINPVIDRSGEPFGTEPTGDSKPRIIRLDDQAETTAPGDVYQPIDQPVEPFTWTLAYSEVAEARMSVDHQLHRCPCGDPGCGEVTRRVFAPGHDAKMVSRLLYLVRQGTIDYTRSVAVIRAVGGTSALVAKFDRAYWKRYTSDWRFRDRADDSSAAQTRRDSGTRVASTLDWYEATETCYLTVQTTGGQPTGMLNYEHQGEQRYAWRMQYRLHSGYYHATSDTFPTAIEALLWDAAHGSRTRYYANGY